MKPSPTLAHVLVLSLLVGACGGDSSGTTATAPTNGGGGTSPPSTSACSLRARQDFALAALNEWYLFPETLSASPDPTPYATVEAYIDALTLTARNQGRDRYFTYLTSIAEENAFFGSGSSAGFGVRISADASARRVFVTESFEGAPALAAGIDRGDELVAIGRDANTLRNVSDIIATEGGAGLSNAFGPDTAGTSRTFRVTNAAGTRTVAIAKADFVLSPVSSRYGSQVIVDNGRSVGYINLRTFIFTADNQLRSAFDSFRAQGITDYVIDFRYNGGGLVSTAELIGDLLGQNRNASEVFSLTTFRPEKASNNNTRRFNPQPQSVSPIRVAFIGTGATASASELVINAFIPYLGTNMALVGSNTYGKPVGQIAVDRSACDDRIRVIAFSTRNAANSDAYFNGLAATVPNTCRASDDLSRQLGDPREASTRQALDFLSGRPCTPIAGTGQIGLAVREAGPRLLTPGGPTVAQREIPGLF